MNLGPAFHPRPDGGARVVERAQFEGDGTFRWAAAPDLLEDRPQQEGEFWLEEGQLFLKDISGTYLYRTCVGSPAASCEVVELVAKDHSSLVTIDDACKTLKRVITDRPFVWVSP